MKFCVREGHHISSRTQNFIDSSHIFTNVKKEHLLPEYNIIRNWILQKYHTL